MNKWRMPHNGLIFIPHPDSHGIETWIGILIGILNDRRVIKRRQSLANCSDQLLNLAGGIGTSASAHSQTSSFTTGLHDRDVGIEGVTQLSHAHQQHSYQREYQSQLNQRMPTLSLPVYLQHPFVESP